MGAYCCSNTFALTVSVSLGPTESISVPPIDSLPLTDLIFDNHLPYYNANGYLVTQVMAFSGRVQSMLTILFCYRAHTNAQLSLHTETGGIPLRLPIDAILQHSDLLMLWTIYKMVVNLPLVTSFVPHDAAGFCL